MVFDKNHEIISFKQSKWLEKKINCNTQKRNKAKKDFYNLLKNIFLGKTMGNVRNRMSLDFI